MHAVVNAVCQEYGIEKEHFFKDGRATKRAISIPKQEAYYIIKLYVKAKSPEIAKFFKMNPSTIRHGWRLVAFEVDNNSETADRIKRIRQNISLSSINK